MSVNKKAYAKETAPRPKREGTGGGSAYREAIDYLFNVAPLFQNIGQGAYKEGLSNTHVLDAHFGHPHSFYRTIHVGGTNGKGSVSHTLAAILQSAGYRVGLYTSPHLVDFRERIRVNGEMIPEQRVIDFVEQERAFFEPLHPSFFELTTALAFQYFKEQQVDIAVIEVGLGGRLDCTNIITPILSVITNISLEHTQFLGDTLEKIAFEKAGIIKPDVPVVIGETNGHKGVRNTFTNKALETNSKITFADEVDEIKSWHDGIYETRHFGTFQAELRGLCQEKNTATILAAIKIIQNLKFKIQDKPSCKKKNKDNAQPILNFELNNFDLSDEAIRQGFAHVCELTGLMGRWQKIQDNPTVICDTGHNPGGLQYIAEQLRTIHNSPLGPKGRFQSEAGKEFIIHNKPFSKNENANSAQPNCALCITHYALRIVLGMVSDKDVRTSLSYFPKDATYYFTQASVKRAMPAVEIAALGKELGLCPAEGHEEGFPTVREAYEAALRDASPNDFIFVGGSSFIVADLLAFLQK